METANLFVDVDGIKTHYLECGPVSTPPIVLIHGGGAGASAEGNWGQLLPGFARNFHVLAADMVGFAKTDKPEPENDEDSQ